MSRSRKERAAARRDAQRRRWTTIAVVAGVIGVAGAFFAVRDRTPAPAISAEELAALEVAPQQDALAPDFTLTNPNGETVSLSDFRGKQVALNFMHTW